MRFQASLTGNGHRQARFKTTIWCCTAAVLLGTGGGLLSAVGATEATAAGTKAASGPTLRLGTGGSESNSTAAFMYFVPLISPEPVTTATSQHSTQVTRISSVRRQQSGNTFTATCDFEFAGQGSQQSRFDPTRQIQRHERELRAGGVLDRQLCSITVAGQGRGQVEVEGKLDHGVPTVTQVRLRFNAQGQPSPVSIGLSDIRYVAGGFRPCNDVVARVNTLTFHKAGPANMEVSIASVKKKEAGDGLWANFKAGLKGAAANLMIPPLSIEVAGHEAVLDFGQALAAGAPSFTFPLAKNLKQSQG